MTSSFYKLLSDSVGKQIRVERHGPDMEAGILWHCGSDYFVLKDEACQLTVYPVGSVHAFCIATESKPTAPQVKDEKGPDETSISDLEPGVYHFDSETAFDFRECDHFADVLCSIPRRIVQIGKGGPDKVRGILLDVESDYISMINDIKEVIYIPCWAIKCLICNPGKKPEPPRKPSGNGLGCWFR